MPVDWHLLVPVVVGVAHIRQEPVLEEDSRPAVAAEKSACGLII